MLFPFYMANAAHNAPKLQLGKLSAEDAERLASTFRPVWELDDAPFAPLPQGSALSAADVDALGAGAGVTPSVRSAVDEQSNPDQRGGTYELKPQAAPRVPAPDEPKVEIAVELEAESEPVPAVAAPPRAPATLPPAPRSHTPPKAPPVPVRMNDVAGSGAFVPVKKSTTPIVLVAVGAVALLAIVFGVHAMTGGSKTTTAATATAAPTHVETTTIPPPPPVAPPQTETPVAAQPAATHEIAAPATAEPTHEAPPRPTAEAQRPPAHGVAVTPRVTHAAPTATHRGSHGHSTIVRDNPF